MTDALKHAKAIVAKLARAGYTAYFAGGWVRDFVMGHPSEDIDIATDASPPEIMDLFPRTILVGLAFGVVIVVFEGHQFEVATFRKDLAYKNGRHPLGIEMSTPFEDARRRDFTINGMFYDPLEGVIHDYVLGQEDIRHGIIRTIGDPHERFFEDRLRMLRAFRFSARFAFCIDPETQEAIRDNADKLFPSVAMERVWLEFNKMAAYPRFDQAIVEMHQLGLLGIIFPEIEHAHIKELRKSVASFPYFPSPCPAPLFLMEIFTSLSFEKKMEIAKRLKMTNKEIKLIEYMEMLSQAIMEDDNGIAEPHRLAALFANPHWEMGMRVISLRYGKGEEAGSSDAFFQKYQRLYESLKPHIERARVGKPLVSADLLLKQGIPPGKRLGLLLKEAERIAVEQNLSDEQAVLEKLSAHSLWKEAF